MSAGAGPGSPAPPSGHGPPAPACGPGPPAPPSGQGPHRPRHAQLRAAAGTAAFLLVAPGVVAGLIPYLLTGWDAEGGAPLGAVVGGWLLVAAGLAALLPSFARFALEGLGTPAPVAPTEHLVVTGLYRHVRNPMYLAVAALIVGQALLLGRAALLLYAALFGVAVVAFVRGYEEPALSRRFGAEYEAYRRAVPGWWPRRRPWSP